MPLPSLSGAQSRNGDCTFIPTVHGMSFLVTVTPRRLQVHPNCSRNCIPRHSHAAATARSSQLFTELHSSSQSRSGDCTFIRTIHGTSFLANSYNVPLRGACLLQLKKEADRQSERKHLKPEKHHSTSNCKCLITSAMLLLYSRALMK